MNTRHNHTHRRLPLAGWLFASMALAAFTGAQPGGGTSAQAQDAPRIVSTSPKSGATDVDPALKEITVTFDRDMGGGMSWTGGGPEMPASPKDKRAAWRDKRTCVLPVQLVPGHRYRVGINAPSFHNFRSEAGVAAAPAAIFFTTQGAEQNLQSDVKPPRVLSMNPANGAQDVSPSITMLSVTFNTAMAEGFAWTGGGPQMPKTPEGRRPYWTKDHKTCVLPVELAPGSSYRLGLNSPSFKGFQSAAGVPLEPVNYTFTTKSP
jgi:hypothetical protein